MEPLFSIHPYLKGVSWIWATGRHSTASVPRCLLVLVESLITHVRFFMDQLMSYGTQWDTLKGEVILNF